MIELITSPLCYVFVTLAIYFLFAFLQKKTKSPLFNPLLWSIVFVIGYILLMVFAVNGSISKEAISSQVASYKAACNIFDIMLGPVTVSLALPLYLNRHVVKENWLAILVASIVGVVSSILTVWGLSALLGLEQDIMFSLFPRGVTTAIATEVATLLGASEHTSLTVTVVALTGVVGAVLGPLLIKLFGSKDDVIVGLSLGSASHAIGTSKAFDYSSKAGAIASISIITNGLVTVLLAIIIKLIVG